MHAFPAHRQTERLDRGGLNRFHLSLAYEPGGGFGSAPAGAFADGRLRIVAENLHPPLRQFRRGSRRIFLIGNPIAEGRRSDERVLALLARASCTEEFARQLNGSFLIVLYDTEDGTLEILNDRFASLAFYFTTDGAHLSGSTSLKQLYDARDRLGIAKPDPDAVFEFIYFRRLFGEKTLEARTSFLTSAAVLRVTPATPRPEIEKYWHPDYESRAPRGRALVREIADRLEAAVRMHMADTGSVALMLSGGLDSRAILAAAERPPVCLTTGQGKNNEFRVAAEVAAARGARHRFIRRPDDLYDSVIDDAVFLTGGMQVYSEVQFMGYAAEVLAHADTVLLGLGLDIFFGGLYLPKAVATLFGRPALHHRLEPLSTDMVGDFIARVRYRLKTSDPFSIVRVEHRARLSDSLRAPIGEILQRGRGLGASGYDLWEYMHLHNLSRHYSFPMMASVRTFADCRSPALENGLFDLAIAMSAEDKVNGTAYQRAIVLLDPAVMAVRNANTNVRAAWSLPLQTWAKAVLFAGNRLAGTAYPASPSWPDRSWPLPREALKACPRIRCMAAALARSERLADLGFLDMSAVARVLEDHEAGRHDHAVLINLLLTVDRFLARPVSTASG